MASNQTLNIFLRYGFLRQTLVIAVLVITGVPLIGHFAIFPLFEQSLIENTEDKAIRVGDFLSSLMRLDELNLEIDTLPPEINLHAQEAITNLGLAKLKLFDRNGMTIYSSDKEDINKRNTYDYFLNYVTLGNPYTVVVKKDKPSLEGQFYTVDVVETYVPIMSLNGKFDGAFEIYFDITEGLARIRQLNNYILLTSIIGGFLLLTVLFFLLLRTGRSFEERRKVDQQLQVAKHQKELILDTAGEGIFGVDNKGVMTFANRAAVDMLGFPLEKLLHSNHHDLIHHSRHDGSSNPIEQCIVRKSLTTGEIIKSEVELFWRADGNSFPVDITVTPLIEDNRVSGAVAAFHDITKQQSDELALREANEKLEKLSYIDFMTGIPNRRSFEQILGNMWRHNLRLKQSLSILMIDIDYFKRFNDSYGHQVGDDCLKDVASTLSRGLYRPGDFLARYGGEEFVLILSETFIDGAELVAKRLCESIESLQILNEGSEVSKWVTISLGIASTIPVEGNSSEELIRQADKALYEAKKYGRNTFVTFKPEITG